jgi:GT2 family glycosyltransferase
MKNLINCGFVSIVILNWNGAKFIQQCIESVLLQSYTNYEIIVIDNGSMDGSIEIVTSNYKNITVVINKVNMGFAHGMNQGIQASRGEYLLLLNEDAYLEKDFILNGLAEFDSDPKIGWVGGVVREMTHSHRVDTVISTAYALRGRFQLKPFGSELDRVESLIVSQCAMLLRRVALMDAALDNENWLDSSYFAYWEDTDLGLRLFLRGWKCIFTPSMCAWHFVSGSVDGKRTLVDKPTKFRRMALRNRHSTIIKNLPTSVLALMLPKLLLVEIIILIYYAVFSFPTLICNIMALWDTALNFKLLVKRRSIVQNRRIISSKDFSAFYHSGF